MIQQHEILIFLLCLPENPWAWLQLRKQYLIDQNCFYEKEKKNIIINLMPVS